MKVRKKPVVVEATQITIDMANGKEPWPEGLQRRPGQGNFFIQNVHHGRMTANVGDWVITGVEGEVYPCNPAIFEKTYERVRPSLLQRFIDVFFQRVE